MRRLFLVLALIPMITFGAEDFVIMWLNCSASNADKVAVRNGLQTLLNDKSKINTSDLARWRLIANTNTVGWVININVSNLDKLGVDKSKITVEKLNEWKTEHMTNPNHLKCRRGESWETIMIEEGMEAIKNFPPK